MDRYQRTILGRCVQAPLERFGFIEVIAEYIDDKLITYADIAEEFPSIGTVWLWASPGIPVHINTVHVWTVEPNEKVDRTKSPYSEYICNPSKPAGIPLEVYNLKNVDSEQELRNRLMAGIFVPFVPSAKLLLHLDSGVLVGPLSMTYSLEDRLWKIEERELSNPIGYWDNANSFGIIQVNVNHYSRLFSNLLTLPECNGFFDCASPTEKFKSVLNYTKKIGLIDVSKKVIQQITEIAQIIEQPFISSRCSEATSMLEQGLEIIDFDVRPVLEHALETEPFASEKEKIIKEATEEAVVKIKHQHKDLVSEIDKLEKQKTKLTTQLKTMHKEQDSLKQEIDQTVKVFNEKMTEAVNNAGNVLSNIAILKPFLEANPVSSKPDNSKYGRRVTRLISSDTQPEIAEWRTVKEVISALENNLKLVGANNSSASDMALMTLASLLENNCPIFKGSAAIECFNVIGRVICGKEPEIIDVGLGWNCSEELFHRALSFYETETDYVSPALLINGINLSPPEAYLIPFLQQLRVIKTSKIVPLGLSMAEGIIAPPLSSNVWDFGPAIETEAWLSKLNNNLLNARVGKIKIKEWTNWAEEKETLSLPSEFLDLLIGLEEKGIYFRLAHRRNIQNIYSRLLSMECDEQQALRILLTGWVVPLMKDYELSGDSIEEVMGLYWSSEDPTLKRFLRLLKNSGA